MLGYMLMAETRKHEFESVSTGCMSMENTEHERGVRNLRGRAHFWRLFKRQDCGNSNGETA